LDLKWKTNKQPDLEKDVNLSFSEWTKDGQKGLQVTMTIEKLYGCFEDLKFTYKCYGTGAENEGMMSACFHQSQEGVMRACSNDGSGITIKCVWWIPERKGHKHEGPSDAHISRGIDFFEVIPPSSVETTGHTDRPGMMEQGVALKKVKCNIDSLDVTFKQIKQDLIDEIGVSLFAEEIRRALSCFVVDKLRGELKRVDHKVTEMIHRIPVDQLSLQHKQETKREKETANAMKPSGKWTSEWTFLEAEEKVKRSQEKFETVFVATSRRH